MVDTYNDLIDTHIAAEQTARGYMGLSQIGTVYDCPRKAWYIMHGFIGKPFDGRLLRLFRTGFNIEDDIVKDLRDAGCDIHSDQLTVTATQEDKCFNGHIDGILDGRLLEIKSTNQKGFNFVNKYGYDAWKHTYKAQIHIYATLLELDEIIVCVECKNTTERYWEIIPVDNDYAVETLRIAFDIYNNPKPHGGCADWQARFCDYRKICLS